MTSGYPHKTRMRQLGFLVGGDAYIGFMYCDNVSIVRIIGLLPPLSLLIFLIVLRIKQK